MKHIELIFQINVVRQIWCLQLNCEKFYIFQSCLITSMLKCWPYLIWNVDLEHNLCIKFHPCKLVRIWTLRYLLSIHHFLLHGTMQDWSLMLCKTLLSSQNVFDKWKTFLSSQNVFGKWKQNWHVNRYKNFQSVNLTFSSISYS